MTTDAPAYAEPSHQPDPSPTRQRRRWLYAGIAAWAALLLVGTFVSVRHDAPTVREQRTIEQAAPVVDRAIGDLVAAAGPGVVVELADRQVRPGCRLTLLRDGATLDGAVTMRTAVAEAPGLLDRIVDRLPADYRAGVRHRAEGTAHVFRADAGEFVAIEGGLTGPGVVTLTATTGCRPTSGDPDDRAVPPLPPADQDPVKVLTALGATEVAPVGLAAARCPGQGVVWTARAAGRGAPAGPLSAVLPRPAGSIVVADTPELYAYRAGPLSIVIEAGDGRIRVAATTGCA